MARADKAAAVAELAAAFRNSQGAVLTEYRGLSVADLAELRTTLGTNATYAIVKNTLTKIAARDADVDGFEDLLVGPSAIAFLKGDAVEAAKGLRDFARTHPYLVIKGGVLDGAPLTPAELTRLADVESREVLLAKLAGAMKASLSGAAALFQAPLAQAVRTVDALRAKVEADSPAADSAAGTDTEAAPVESTDAEGTGSTEAASTEATDAEAASTVAPDTAATSTEAPEPEGASTDATTSEAPDTEATSTEAPDAEAPTNQ